MPGSVLDAASLIASRTCLDGTAEEDRSCGVGVTTLGSRSSGSGSGSSGVWGFPFPIVFVSGWSTGEGGKGT